MSTPGPPTLEFTERVPVRSVGTIWGVRFKNWGPTHRNPKGLGHRVPSTCAQPRHPHLTRETVGVWEAGPPSWTQAVGRRRNGVEEHLTVPGGGLRFSPVG